MTHLVVEDLWAKAGGTEVLRGVNLEVSGGQVHAVMGPNGSGKSTLAHVLMGRPNFEVTRGAITLDGQNLVGMSTYERAQAGLFLGMQSPIEIPGVNIVDMLAASYEAAGRDTESLMPDLLTEAELVELDVGLLKRSVNDDFSGGEKKRSEAVQLAVLRPKVAVLDEVDSGLDIDALASISKRIERATQEPVQRAGNSAPDAHSASSHNGDAHSAPDTREGDAYDGDAHSALSHDRSDCLAVLTITHYSRLFAELKPDKVSVLIKGRIATTGGIELAHQIESGGFEQWDTPDEISVGIRLGI